MELAYKNEKPLFLISLIISLTFWTLLIAGTMGAALLYILFFFLFYLFAQSAFISYIKGTGVKITAEQFPDLHQELMACREKLSMQDAPETYLLHADGAFNALATRFLKRNYIVLFSDVVDALDSHLPALRFYIGHELGHIKRKHLIWGPILAPAGILPLIGAAYSRAREYTCDNHGYACCDDPKDAVYGLTALAAGGKRWKKIALKNYVNQASQTGGFWMSFHELIADYPWLVKRAARLVSRATNRPAILPRRHLLAWLIALFIPRGGGKAGGGSALIMVAIVGILAAIAIPQFAKYQQRAMEQNAASQLQGLQGLPQLQEFQQLEENIIKVR